MKRATAFCVVIVLLTATAAFGDWQTVTATYTQESRNPAGWGARDDACKYAISAAQRKAENQCTDEVDGKLVYILTDKNGKQHKTVDQCFSCRETKYFEDWYCSGRSTVRCQYSAMTESSGSINDLRGMVQGEPDNDAEENTPCTENPESNACLKFLKQKKPNLSQGVRD